MEQRHKLKNINDQKYREGNIAINKGKPRKNSMLKYKETHMFNKVHDSFNLHKKIK